VSGDRRSFAQVMKERHTLVVMVPRARIRGGGKVDLEQVMGGARDKPVLAGMHGITRSRGVEILVEFTGRIFWLKIQIKMDEAMLQFMKDPELFNQIRRSIKLSKSLVKVIRKSPSLMLSCLVRRVQIKG
jgi:hypothetical protein